jgi:hypothetical protein
MLEPLPPPPVAGEPELDVPAIALEVPAIAEPALPPMSEPDDPPSPSSMLTGSFV